MNNRFESRVTTSSVSIIAPLLTVSPKKPTSSRWRWRSTISRGSSNPTSALKSTIRRSLEGAFITESMNSTTLLAVPGSSHRSLRLSRRIVTPKPRISPGRWYRESGERAAMGLRDRRPVGHRRRLTWRGEVSGPVAGERPEPRVGRARVRPLAPARRTHDGGRRVGQLGAGGGARAERVSRGSRRGPMTRAHADRSNPHARERSRSENYEARFPLHCTVDPTA